MFSAKFTNKIKNMAKSYLKPNKIIVAVGILEGKCKYVEQTIKIVNKFDKKRALLSFMKEIGMILFFKYICGKINLWPKQEICKILVS